MENSKTTAMRLDDDQVDPSSTRGIIKDAPVTGIRLTSEPAGAIALSDSLKNNYDSYYDGESAWRALGAVGKAKNVMALCQALPHRRILEIGCGEGAILKRLSDLNFGDELYSVEISETGVRAVNARNIARAQECRRFDGYNLPYESRKFDLAILSHVLEHAEYPRKLLYESDRVADYVFIEVPLEDTIRLKPDFVLDSVGHINFYSRKAIRHLAQTCGFRVLSQVVTNPSRAMYEYQYGRKGIPKYMIKQFLLAASEPLACALFSYHSSLVCTRASE